MSYMQHEYRPYPVGSEYAGTCKACARREEDHDLSPSELLARTLKKGIENASPAALMLNEEIVLSNASVQTPVDFKEALENLPHKDGKFITTEHFNLGKAVIDVAVKLYEYGLTPTTPDGVGGSDRFICMYCNEPVGTAHKDDCLWLMLGLAVAAYAW